MATPFIGQIAIFGFNFTPRNWAACNGQLLAISQNTALFSILGTTYGGNGQTNFALPDMRGRVPIHAGTGAGLPTRTLGERAGLENVTITSSTMPSHTHSLLGTTATSTRRLPAGKTLGTDSASIADYYAAPGTNMTALAPASVTNAGSGQPHNNMQPYLVVNICIALFGIFPSRN